MVFRRKFGNSLRPVNRIKHVVDIQNALTATTGRTEVIADTVDSPLSTNPTEVQTASTINAIYLTAEVTRVGTTSDVLANFYMTVAKNPGNNLTMPEANAVGPSDNKKYVIHQEMVMLQGTNAGNPRTVFKGVIVLPKGYRRNGVDDRLQLRFFSPGVAVNYCFEAIYKEFR